MILRCGKFETICFVLPRDRQQFLTFLSELKLDPKEATYEIEDTIDINKEVVHWELVEKWLKYTGYDKILKKYMESHTWRQFEQQEAERLKKYENRS